MKTQFIHNANLISKRFSQDTLIKITGRSLILPFYHTVSSNPAPHFSQSAYFRTKQQFADDLDYFSRHFESVEAGSLDQANKGFHLSFDDGMSEMYHVVFPMLIERKIHATFFINSDFVDNKKMFISHKKSLIQFEIKNSDYLQKSISGFLDVSTHQLLQEISNINAEERIDEIALRMQVDFRDYLNEKKPYLTKLQISELKDAGFGIGNHGRSHRNFNTLSFKEQKGEIETVNAFLKEIGVTKLLFAFPYGDHKIRKELFDWMYSEGEIAASFGVSGLKSDDYANHHHRILMEQSCFSAEEIIKAEYFYYFWKSFIFRNKIRR